MSWSKRDSNMAGILLLTLLLLVHHVSMGQVEWVIRQHITTKEGLPQNTIRDMHYDKYGYLWLGTENGLARWDGKEIRTLSHKDAPKLLETGRINSIHDDHGRLIINVEGQPNRLISLSRSFSLDTEIIKSQNYPSSPTYHLWDFTRLLASEEIARLPGVKSELQALPIRAFSNDGITGVIALHEKVIWYDGRHAIIRDWKIDWEDELFKLGNSFFGIHNRRELYRIDPDNPHVPIREGSFYHHLTALANLPNSALKVLMYQGPPLAHDGSNIYLLTVTNNIPELSLLASHLSFSDNSIIIYNEATGLLAAGTINNGFYILQRSCFQTLHSDILPGIKENDDGDIFYAIMPYSKDYIFSHRGLIPLKPGSPYVHFGSGTLAIALWNHHYIISGYHTTFLFNSPFDKYREKAVLYNGSSGIFHYEIPKDSSLLILHGNELVRHSLTTGVNEVVVSCPSKDQFRCLLPLSDSTIIIGAWRNAFYCNLTQRTLQPIPYFKGINVRGCYRDARGWIWIGTYGNGFYSWNGHHITHYPVDKLGNLAVINGFLEDGLGYIWITTNNGLFRYWIEDLQRYDNGRSDKLFYNFFDQSRGLVTNEFNYASPCAIKLEDGRLAFSSMKGIVLLDPLKMPFTNGPSVVFTDQVILDSTVIYNPRSGQLHIPAGTEQIAFNVSVAYSSHPYETQLFYRLSAGGHEWNEMPQDRRIIFNRLAKGSYKMEFRIVRSGQDAYTTFAFDVLPFWYETIWAMIACGLLLLCIGLLFYRLGTRALRRQKERLEIVVSERTEGLSTMVTQLNETISSLQESEQELYFSQKEREKFSEMVLHDLQSPLKFLSDITDHFHEELEAGNVTGLRELSRKLKQSTRQISELSIDYLNWLKTATGSSQKKREWTEARKIMEKVCTLFTELARDKNNTLTCKPGDKLMLFTIPDYLEIIIRNLVDNANKHTRRGVISLACFESMGVKKIHITDTGEGIDAAGLARINDLFAGHEVTVTPDSLGLQIVYGLLMKCGGQLQAESTPGKGMTITLSFTDIDPAYS